MQIINGVNFSKLQKASKSKLFGPNNNGSTHKSITADVNRKFAEQLRNGQSTQIESLFQKFYCRK